MNILVIDGQGGRLGRKLVENIRKICPEATITAVGTNSMATESMMNSGCADHLATGENAVIVACRSAQIIVGPFGIATADAMLGEITPSMAFELATYGGMAGWLRQSLPKTKAVTYAVLLIAMIAGRLVWGTARLILAGLSGNSFTWSLFLAGAVVDALPGIILQLVLIPILVIAMDRAGLSLNRA